jgi:putative glutamine amidotransferase
MLRAILMGRPLVAVPTYPRLEAGRVRGWTDAGIGLPARYIDALHRAGGREACFVPEAWTDTDSEALVARVDGLLLVGGGDLEPSTYRAAPHTTIYGVDPERDACELSLVRAAIAAELPTFAICRGQQLLAVALGGTLDQDLIGRVGLLDHGRPGVEGGARRHNVDVLPGSRLAEALGTTVVSVSSHHHQAVAELEAPARVVAQAPDGVIEALELDPVGGPWMVAVQWHPEDTAAADPTQQGLFDAFVQQCTTRRQRFVGARSG